MFVQNNDIMKRILLCTLCFYTLLLMACMGIGRKEKYTPLPAEGKTIDVTTFNAIKAEGVFNIILSQGDKESVVIKGDMPEGLDIKNEGETLMITDTLNGKLQFSRHVVKTDIYVTIIDVNSISIESVGTTECKDTLKLKRLDFGSEGVGASTLWLNSDSINVSQDGVGKLTLAGNAALVKIESSGVGALDAKELKADILHLEATGVGSAKVYAIKELYLQSSGVGGVEYYGPAKVMENVSSGVGKVEKEN